MWYIEYVRARRALTVYAIIVAAIVALALLVRVNVNVYPQSGPIHTPIDILTVTSGFIIAILGTVLATSLSSHVSGHLEIAWTKPIPRDRLIAQTFAIDIGALAVAYVATMIVAITINAVFGSHLDYTTSQLGHVAAELLFPIALYAMVQGVTSAVGRRAGMIAGLAWPVMLLAGGVIPAPVPPFVHQAIVAINFLNPLALLSTNMRLGHYFNILGRETWSPLALGDAGLIVALGFAFALVQWRRLEV
jgi:hypothetical protein